MDGTLSSSSTTPALPFDVAETFDVVFWGALVSIAMFGITLVQGWTYMNQNDDRWPLHVLIGSLVLLDFVGTVLVSQLIQDLFVASYGEYTHFHVVPLYLDVDLLISIVMVFLVQVFFASRVYLLHNHNKRNQRMIVPSVILFFACGAFAAGIVLTLDNLNNRDMGIFTWSTKSMKIEASLTNALAVVSDIITTIAMSLTLDSVPAVGVGNTRTTIQKLLFFIVSRGILVSVFQTGVMIMFVIRPESLMWTPLHFSLSKIYLMTTITMLNARPDLRRKQFGGVISASTSSSIATIFPSLSDGRRVSCEEA